MSIISYSDRFEARFSNLFLIFPEHPTLLQLCTALQIWRRTKKFHQLSAAYQTGLSSGERGVTYQRPTGWLARLGTALHTGVESSQGA